MSSPLEVRPIGWVSSARTDPADTGPADRHGTRLAGGGPG